MRLIDADALMDNLGIAVECKDCTRNGTFGCTEDSAFVYACECITDAPTINAVEVVRCKDCKWYRKGHDDVYYCQFHDDDILWQDDDYCSYGKMEVEHE